MYLGNLPTYAVSTAAVRLLHGFNSIIIIIYHRGPRQLSKGRAMVVAVTAAVDTGIIVYYTHIYRILPLCRRFLWELGWKVMRTCPV